MAGNRYTADEVDAERQRPFWPTCCRLAIVLCDRLALESAVGTLASRPAGVGTKTT